MQGGRWGQQIVIRVQAQGWHFLWSKRGPPQRGGNTFFKVRKGKAGFAHNRRGGHCGRNGLVRARGVCKAGGGEVHALPAPAGRPQGRSSS